MTKQELQVALDAMQIETPDRATVAELRRVFARNRREMEEFLSRPQQPSNTADRSPQQTYDEEPSISDIPDAFNQEEPTQDHRDSLSEEEELDRELALLRRRREILCLRREIEQLERGYAPAVSNTTAAPTQTEVRKIHFHDIEHAIVKFSGEDRTYGVREFFRHLEQIFSQVHADELLKFLTLRNSLTGAARLLLTRGALTYDELKASLVKEFGRSISRQEVYQTLRNRRKKMDETVRRYVMEMESIASRSDVTEFELVAFVQEGLNNRIPDFQLFTAARTIDEVKDAVSTRVELLDLPSGASPGGG